MCNSAGFELHSPDCSLSLLGWYDLLAMVWTASGAVTPHSGKKERKLGKKLPKRYKKLEFLVVWSPHNVVERIETGEIPFPYKDLIDKIEFEPIKQENPSENINK